MDSWFHYNINSCSIIILIHGSIIILIHGSIIILIHGSIIILIHVSIKYPVVEIAIVQTTNKQTNKQTGSIIILPILGMYSTF